MDQANFALEEARKRRRDRSIQLVYTPPFKMENVKRSHQKLPIAQLVPFSAHPFRPYDENRLNDLTESIKVNGVISPVIARPLDNGKYEILSGHNRVNAARKAGLEAVPTDILEGLTDDDAKLIVAESNLIQRSFSEMLHSERAAAIFLLYDAIKKKSGYRSDLIEGIEAETCSPQGNRPRTMEKIGEKYSLSKNTIARYLRISRLIKPLQDMIDNDVLSVRAAVELSYLSIEEQTMVEQLCHNNQKMNIHQAKMLRESASKGSLTQETAEQILKKSYQKEKTVTISRSLFTQYFQKDQTPEEIEQIVAKASELYFCQNG